MASRQRKAFIIINLIGILIIAVAGIFSPAMVGKLLSSSGSIGDANLIQEINFARIILGALGLGILFFGKKLASLFATNYYLGFFSCFFFWGFLWIGLELNFKLALDSQRGTNVTKVQGKEPVNRKITDDVLGYKPPPGASISDVKAKPDYVIYEATYNHNALSQRKANFDETMVGKYNDFALFFGDSITYGSGVEDNETFSARFAEAKPGLKSFNLGVQGYGPQQMLAFLEDDNKVSELKAYMKTFGQLDSGSCRCLIFTFIDDHFSRASGSMRIVQYGGSFPYYEEDSHGELIRNGNFLTGRPLTTRLYRLIGRSYIVQHFGFDLPTTHTENAVDLTAKIIGKSKKIFKEKFGSDRFYFFYYPGSKPVHGFLEKLKEQGVEVLDHSAMPWDKSHQFKGDAHPNPHGHKTLSDAMVKGIL